MERVEESSPQETARQEVETLPEFTERTASLFTGDMREASESTQLVLLSRLWSGGEPGLERGGVAQHEHQVIAGVCGQASEVEQRRRGRGSVWVR